MKRTILALLLLLTSLFSAYAATITWIGPSGSNWNNVVNWSSGTIPGTGDDVIFNSSVTVEMDIIPATTPFVYAINSLWVATNAAVILSRTQAGGGMRILQIRSLSTTVYGLRIDNGSTLTINANNTTGTLVYILDLTGAAGVTGQVSGNLYFTGTGAGTGSAHLNIYASATNYANLTVRNTGVIKYFINSGNTNSAAGSVLTMESGSIYEINKNGGSVPFGTWDDNSNILISGATTNGGINFSQYQYGNLEWNTPAMSAVTQMIANLSTVTSISLNNVKIVNTNTRELRLKTGAASASPPYEYTIRGNLEIASTGILVITGINVANAGAGARLHLMGDLTNSGTLKSDGIAGTVNDLKLNGSDNQDISNTGIFSGTQLKFIMNNAAGVTLLTPLTLPGTTNDALQLNNGKIKTSTAALLTMIDNSNYSGGSSTSLIEGPMKKIGNDNFLFPVGKGNIYAPIGFSSAGMAVTDAFEAEYFRLNPQTAYGISYQTPPIDHISYLEYWKLEKTSGDITIPANVTLTVTPYSFAKNINTLYVARYNVPDVQWKNSGISLRSPGPTSPPYITGSITSAPVTQFGVFTLATTDPEAANPLPLNIISFGVKKINSRSALLNWEMSGNSDAGAKFEVQRANNKNEFMTLSIIQGNEPTHIFNFYDNQLPDGIVRYRLKIKDIRGDITYSRIAILNSPEKESVIAFIYPNPVYDHAIVTINSSVTAKTNLVLYDAAGKIIRRWTESVSASNGSFTIYTDNLLPGIYLLSVNMMGSKQVVRFIKR